MIFSSGMMTAIEISCPGGPENLVPVNQKIPEPRNSELLVQVFASGVNRPDLLQRRGKYPPPEGTSNIPGLEISGRVVSVGSAVKRWSPGDLICGLVSGGGYAEYCVVPETQALRIPNGLDNNYSAALPETFFTVWHNVFEKGQLNSGERLLIHGGSGGIGSTAIQLALALGAEVFTTAGTSEKCRFCEDLGATRSINYHESQFNEVIMDLTNGEGVDVILDMIGGPYLNKNLSILREGGRLSLIGFLGGSISEINMVPILKNRLTVFGTTLRSQPPIIKEKIAKSLENLVWPLLDKGSIKPVIGDIFKLSEANKAHSLMESGLHQGKIILVTGKT